MDLCEIISCVFVLKMETTDQSLVIDGSITDLLAVVSVVCPVP